MASIHDEVPSGEVYAGNEARIDVQRDYFVDMASRSGLLMQQTLGLVCGQPTFVFSKH